MVEAICDEILYEVFEDKILHPFYMGMCTMGKYPDKSHGVSSGRARNPKES